MSLTKVNYIDNSTIITAKNLNDIQDNIIELQNNRPKAGFIYPLATSTVPDGFLLCDGAEYLRAEYPELFAAIGTMYGEGDGNTTFNVPNLQTRVPVGKGEGYELGDIGGEAEHTLTIDEMPSHYHKITGDMNYGGGASGSGYYIWNQANNYNNNGTLDAGGSQPHNNMQPYTVVNYIIATGKKTGISVTDIIMGAQAIPLGIEYGGTGATSAEMARRNLEITPDNIGALSMELLWENASPTSEFVAQTIPLTLKKGDLVTIEASEENTGGAYVYAQCIVGCQSRLFLMSNYRQTRAFTVTTTGITFNEGKAGAINSSLATSNISAIPKRIFVTKGVSA